MKNIFRMIKKDHNYFRKVFKELENTSTVEEKKRKELYKNLRKAILKHMKAEEKSLYPALKESNAHELGVLSQEEHKATRLMMKQVEKADFSDDEWASRLKILHDVMDDHMSLEEKVVRSAAKKTLSRDQVKHLSEIYRKRRKRAFSLAA